MDLGTQKRIALYCMFGTIALAFELSILWSGILS